MRVLVTGGTGFVGRNLVPEIARSHDVYCVLRDQSRAPDIREARVIEADLTDSGIARRLPDRIDAIIHLAQANLPFPDRATDLFLVNSASTHWLCEYARTAGASKFILASSGSVYQASRAPLREDAPTAARGYYPATKLVSEILLGQYATYFGVAILRIFAPYGPGQVDRLLPRIIESVRTGKPVILSRGGEPRMHPIYINDLVRVIAQATADSEAYTVNVAGPEPASIRELAEIAGRHLGRAPVFEERNSSTPGDFVADTTLMHRLFAVDRLVSLDEGLRSMVGISSPQAN